MTDENKTTIKEESFIDKTFFINNGLIEESEGLYSKVLGKDLDQKDLKFYIEYKPDWNCDLGQCYEFRYNTTKLLLAYCTDENDFISVFKSFNV